MRKIQKKTIFSTFTLILIHDWRKETKFLNIVTLKIHQVSVFIVKSNKIRIHCFNCVYVYTTIVQRTLRVWCHVPCCVYVQFLSEIHRRKLCHNIYSISGSKLCYNTLLHVPGCDVWNFCVLNQVFNRLCNKHFEPLENRFVGSNLVTNEARSWIFSDFFFGYLIMVMIANLKMLIDENLDIFSIILHLLYMCIVGKL